MKRRLIERTAVTVVVAVVLGATPASAQGTDDTALRIQDGKRDNCEAVPTATLDILRHGWALVNADEIRARKTQNQDSARQLAGLLLGGLSASGALEDVFVPVTGGRLRFPEVESPSRREYLREMRKQYREGNGGKTCIQWAEEMAWSYAPGQGTECAGLPNEPVDVLRQSGQFFGEDRWIVRLRILQEYRFTVSRGKTEAGCIEFAETWAASAWLLDP